MYGLIMIKEYLDEILDRDKTYDARNYDTNKRGTIALVDSKKSAIIGLVDLIGTHQISDEKYCKWHATGKWSGYDFQINNPKAIFYAYDFDNPRKFAHPIKIEKTDRVWTRIDDEVKEQFVVQERLF